MGASVSSLATPLAAALVEDLNLGATADSDVRSGATAMYMLLLDNSANAAATYLKLYNKASPSVGTDSPDWVIKVAAGETIAVAITPHTDFTNLSMAAVTTGGTAGTTPPTSAFKVHLFCS